MEEVMASIISIIVIIAAVCLGIAFYACVTAFFGALFMFVFNIVVPAFGGPTITFGVAWAAWVLLSLIGGAISGARS